MPGVRSLPLLLALAGTALAQPVPPAAEEPGLVTKATALSRLAVLLYQQGRLDEAILRTEESLALQRKLYPPDRFPRGHSELANSLNNLGTMRRDRGELARAEPLLREAVAMRRKLHPEGHASVANSLNNLAGVLRDQGELAAAEPLLRESLAIRRKLYSAERFPDGHPELANSLNNLGTVVQAQGDLARAEPLLRDALAMCRRLYPAQRFPNGNPALAISLSSLGMLLRARGELAQAETLLQSTLAMRRQLYPPERFPHGQAAVATSLNNLGLLCQDRGELARAEPYYRQALAMRQRLYPEKRYPNGHPELAGSLNNLAILLKERSELGQAEPYYRQALVMRQKLYPPERFPKGHPDLAQSLNNLGVVLQARGELVRAAECFQDALAMCQKLYAPERFPEGHLNLALCLNNLGTLLQDQGELARAEPYYRQALAMRQRFCAAERFPNGHPDLAGSLSNLGILLQHRGQPARAEPLLQGALAMRQKLYPPERFPAGHPDLAVSMSNLGHFLQLRGETARAEPLCRQALGMQQRLADLVVAGAAEAEAFNYLTTLQPTRDGYLSVTRLLPAQHAASYAALWDGKAAVARLLARRRQALFLTADPAARDLSRQLLEARRQLARLLLAPALTDEQAQRARKVTERKEDLEKQLARTLPAFAALQASDRLRPEDLQKHLPADAVFVDLLRYRRLEPDAQDAGGAGRRWTPCYVAYVLAPAQPVRRVELGEAAPVEAALRHWRRRLAAARGRDLVLEDTPAAASAEDAAPAQALRRLVWAPLARHLPAGTHTLYLAPDGPLTGLPWAALPGNKPGTVLLEEYAVAVVPYGRFLAEQLRPSRERSPAAAGVLLAVGAVSYDRPADAAAPADAARPVLRAATQAGLKLSWPALPATARELDRLVQLAAKRPVRARRGSAAGTAQVLADLPEARWAHLATHGFFADDRVRSVLHLDEQAFERSQRGEQVGVGARNPLVLSGLVLAGANLPVKDPAKEDGGILTALAIAGLNLDDLELAVLSACDTGLGEVAGGEGVFGLQRAFHIAGCRNVIASLWQVDDEATAALMGLFYHHLWQEKRPPLDALRQAQLTLYRHPERIAALARTRGPDFEKAARLPAASGAASARRAPARLWAGFVLSGAGR
jgi:CHAT domain-containing protein/Tfp pilus assembly protein PilF